MILSKWENCRLFIDYLCVVLKMKIVLKHSSKWRLFPSCTVEFNSRILTLHNPTPLKPIKFYSPLSIRHSNKYSWLWLNIRAGMQWTEESVLWTRRGRRKDHWSAVSPSSAPQHGLRNSSVQDHCWRQPFYDDCTSLLKTSANIRVRWDFIKFKIPPRGHKCADWCLIPYHH